MFTGIVECTAKVIERTAKRITVERPAAFDDAQIGASISMAGACLTIVELTEGRLSFDVVAETWQRTTLGQLNPGDRVNLERAMPSNGRFEGHIVQGHVEGVAAVTQAAASGNQWQLSVALPEQLAHLVVPKGSITIDGVSLTVVALAAANVTVALVPHTRKQTTLGALQGGDYVNIETDILGRYVQNQFAKQQKD